MIYAGTMKMDNYYQTMDWDFMLSQYPGKTDFDIKKYYSILSEDWPDFLDKYIQVPSMQRLQGVGLLCGTDWTSLYKNRFYYSRLNHSIGVALIVWHFTRDKIQTLAGLFHDISTPVFSHVADFRKGDALTQTATENETEAVIRSDNALMALLESDGISVETICDYHLYPIADNERPQLSADRLEYMFPSGAALQGSWKLDDIAAVYNDIAVLKDENGNPELGFMTLEKALFYCEKFLETGHVLQLNENKLCLQLLAEITKKAVECGCLEERDFFELCEKDVMGKISEFCENCGRDAQAEDSSVLMLSKMFNAFISMQSVKHTEEKLAGHFCVSVDVKQRYINPLVFCGNEKFCRISNISEKAAKLIEDFLNYHDKPYGCVEL